MRIIWRAEFSTYDDITLTRPQPLLPGSFGHAYLRRSISGLPLVGDIFVPHQPQTRSPVRMLGELALLLCFPRSRKSSRSRALSTGRRIAGHAPLPTIWPRYFVRPARRGLRRRARRWLPDQSFPFVVRIFRRLKSTVREFSDSPRSIRLAASLITPASRLLIV